MHELAFLLQNIDPETAKRIGATILLLLPIFILVGIAIIIVPFWFICKKAGFSPWLSFLNLIPFGNLILIYVLAFAQWKVVPVPQVAWPQPPLPPQPPYPTQS